MMLRLAASEELRNPSGFQRPEDLSALWELEYRCDVWNDFPITLTLHPHPWERTLGWLFLGQWSTGLTGS